MKILITGATGFIGKELLNHLDFAELTAISRSKNSQIDSIEWKHFSLESLLTAQTISDSYDVVIHLAGRAHVLNDKCEEPLAEFRKINTDITIELAKQLAANKLKRFVFVSSIGVNGASTENKLPFTEDSVVAPHSDYAISKHEAEVELSKLSKQLGFELVIVRPPLVYGAKAPGNFGKLVKLVSKGLPLPLGFINNKRSYVSVSNLASFISTCATHPKAANETFLISDGSPISTTELMKKLNVALGVKSILLPVPKVILAFLFNIIGKRNMTTQLLDNLEVDNSKAKRLLNWTPVETIDQALIKLKT